MPCTCRRSTLPRIRLRQPRPAVAQAATPKRHLRTTTPPARQLPPGTVPARPAQRRAGQRMEACRVGRSAVCISPLLWALFSADVPRHIPAAGVVQFADDTTLITRGRSVAEARDQMNRALRQFSEWAADDSVTPEPSTTQLLVPVSSAALRGGATAAGCEMSGAGIPPQEVIKILGVLLEGSLCWEAPAAAACVRSRNASFAVLRAARH